jgi:hypothetical protein
MLDLDSLLGCTGAPGASVCAAGRFVPDASANRLDLRAASQSNGDFTDAALSGDLGE